MVRRRLLISVRSILTGWATLILITWLLERPLLLWTASLLGGSWFPTARLALDCCAFAATGWVIGYWNRTDSLLAVLAFAVTLTVRDFDPVLAINVPWLFRLVADTFRDNRYFDSLVVTAASHAFLFGSLLVGGRLARPAQTPVSIFRDARC
jgi:hypothetical protein